MPLPNPHLELATAASSPPTDNEKNDTQHARTSGSAPSSAHSYTPGGSYSLGAQPFHMPTHRHIEHSSSQGPNIIPPRSSSTGNTAVDRDAGAPHLAAAFGGDLQPGLHYHPAPTTRQFANPAPLGLSAFALTTFVLSLVNLGARGVSKPNIAVPLAFGYGGLVQLLAGMWEMAVGNTFGATALSSYGGFWIAYGILLTPAWNILGPGGPYAQGGTAGNPDLSTMGNAAVGFFLIGWWIFTTILLLCTLRSTLAFFALFLTLDIAFLMLACAEFALDGGKKQVAEMLLQAGGGFGMCAAFLAWYNALAGLVDGSNSFFTIPVYHFPWSEKVRESNARARGKSQRATV